MHMFYGYGFMGGWSGIVCPLIMLVVLVDLILVGVWLWQKISNK